MRFDELNVMVILVLRYFYDVKSCWQENLFTGIYRYGEL